MIKLKVGIQKNANKSTLITQHKTQLQIDHSPQHETRHTEPDDGRESGE